MPKAEPIISRKLFEGLQPPTRHDVIGFGDPPKVLEKAFGEVAIAQFSLSLEDVQMRGNIV